MQTLSLGSEGPLVGLIQDVLIRFGYYNGQIDYKFGEALREAVRDFQKSHNDTADGVVGAQTWGSLEPFLTGNYIYTVKAGDTLPVIAQRANTTEESIIAANPFINPDSLPAGQRLIIPYQKFVVQTNLKYSYEIMQLNIRGLLQRYPFLEIGSAGLSVMGNNLLYLRIGRGGKTVFYNASHHANEWITSVLLMKFIDTFCYSYVNSEDLEEYNLKEIYDTCSIYILPMVNPDGVNLVTGAINKEGTAYMQAVSISEKYPQIPFPDGWKANIRGVDLNLNYPAGWETAREVKYAQGFISPAPRDFVGYNPFSEPESVAVGQFTRNFNPDLILAYHSQGEIIYWKYLDYNPINSYEIAQEFSRVSGYTVEQTPAESGNAGYKDWFIQEYNMPGYTIEVGKGVSPLPLSQFEKIYNDNIGILLLGAILSYQKSGAEQKAEDSESPATENPDNSNL